MAGGETARAKSTRAHKCGGVGGGTCVWGGTFAYVSECSESGEWW